ncbi:Clavaminate synthase-like protein [Hymenopellis radicata]|nr:Clavaminate synthase-like protein [Hymenopellis radicata]
MAEQTLPPFPDDVPTVSLTVVDYGLLQSGDKNEINTLWDAATKQGFWYMKNHGAEHLIEPMFELGGDTMRLPYEDKMKFWQGNSGGSFGYKALGATTVDLKGSKDNCEMINISKDDTLSYPAVAHVPYPEPVNARMQSAVKPFVTACMEANSTILGIFNDKLGLPSGTLESFHSSGEHSVSEARVIKVPPSKDADSIAVGSHTDFGSLSFLANKLGGLQVLLPGEEHWKYVKPLPGHVICNVGDALNILSGGILQSSTHRVLPPPKEQSKYERWSLVFFTRPGNSVPLKALSAQSSIIAASPGKDLDSGATALEWFMRRQSKWRVSNQKTVDDYLASRGTEHTKIAV